MNFPIKIMDTLADFKFSHLRVRMCTLDWALALKNNKSMLYGGVRPNRFRARARNDTVEFEISERAHAYVEYKYQLGTDVFVSARASTRSNLGLAFGYEFGHEGLSIEGYIGGTSHKLGAPTLCSGFSINFEIK